MSRGSNHNRPITLGDRRQHDDAAKDKRKLLNQIANSDPDPKQRAWAREKLSAMR